MLTLYLTMLARYKKTSQDVALSVQFSISDRANMNFNNEAIGHLCFNFMCVFKSEFVQGLRKQTNKTPLLTPSKMTMNSSAKEVCVWFWSWWVLICLSDMYYVDWCHSPCRVAKFCAISLEISEIYNWELDAKNWSFAFKCRSHTLYLKNAFQERH